MSTETPDLRRHAAVRAFLASLEETDAGLDLAVHSDDSMLAFGERLTCGVREQALLEYFRSGHHAWSVLRRLLQRVHGARFPRRAPRRVLDFGAGYGRLTRFLVHELEAQIRAVEADAEAVTFLAGHFGDDARCGDETRFEARFEARISPTDPGAADDLGDGHEPGYDLVLALSVLTHLPEHTFGAWLARWLDALAVDGGVLVFTTLGPSALLPGRTMPERGFHFEAMSESRVLELSEYGTAWVEPAYVGRLIDRITGGLARWRHLERGLWHLQDLWILTLDPGLDLYDAEDVGDVALDTPAGAVETCRLEADGRTLHVAGWATGGRRPPRPARIELHVEDDAGRWACVESVDTAGARPDALRALGFHPPGLQEGADEGADEAPDEAPVGIAFELRWATDEPSPGTALRIDAVDPRNGARHVLHAGSLEAGDLYLRLRHATRRADELQAQVEIFEASGFGRLRRWWMALKERLRA